MEAASQDKLAEVQAAITDCFTTNNQSLTMLQAKAWIFEHYSSKNFSENTVYQQLRGSCSNRAGAYKRDRIDIPKVLWYEKAARSYRLLTDSDPKGIPETEVEKAAEEPTDPFGDKSSAQFALESHLRDYLAKNLGKIEVGLHLWSKEPPSVEFLIGRRRIDVLARDSEGLPVIVELKLSRAYDRVIGQALLYRSLVMEELDVSRVRIILLAFEMTDELKRAAESVCDIVLCEYRLSMEIVRLKMD